MRNIKLILCITIFCITATFYGQALKVGEEVRKSYNSPHPYSGTDATAGTLVWSQSVKHDGASYIAVHFSKFELAEGDYLLVKSPDNERSWSYTGRGNYNSEKPDEGFWSIPIYGSELLIEIHKTSANSDHYGYTIDRYARGYTQSEMGEEDFEALCGSDNSLNARCYQTSEPVVYNRSRAVARLMINGTSACTGWLIGDQGHIMTNNHCVGSSSDANNVTVEFMAEGSTCATNCNSWFGCPGTIAASTTGLVQTHVNLDYSLLSLATNVSGTYGFLQLRPAGATVGERLYIPQHPQAWGKRIALVSDHSSDSSDGNAHVFSITSPRCGGTGNDVGYYADTQGGSSGSPVLGYSDHLVISLHHCGTCPNRGVPIQEIITNLGSNLPNNAIGCIANLVVTANVIAPNTDTRQAGNMITATNTINSGATGIYHAGAQVVFQSGFNAATGSNFRAYIEGCTGVFVARQASVIEEDIKEDNSVTVVKGGLSIAPNPNNGIFKVSIEKPTQGTIEISDLFGITVLRTDFKDKNEFEIDMQQNPKGIYIVKILSGNETFTGKIIRN